MNVLLTGTPGVGKTTVVKKVVSRLSGFVGGFYSEEITEAGKRVGFRIVTVDGRTGVLAHKSAEGTFFMYDTKTKYYINLRDLEWIGVQSILEAIKSASIIVIDEIGHMELFSDKFRDAVEQAVESDKTVFATISKYGGPFEEHLKERPDSKVVEVTLENRDKLPDKVFEMMRL